MHNLCVAVFWRRRENFFAINCQNVVSFQFLERTKCTFLCLLERPHLYYVVTEKALSIWWLSEKESCTKCGMRKTGHGRLGTYLWYQGRFIRSPKGRREGERPPQNKDLLLEREINDLCLVYNTSNVYFCCSWHSRLTLYFLSFDKATVGASFTLKIWGKYNIAIWDTAGQERYIGLSAFYCRNTNVAIMAFDITRRESFKALMWVTSGVVSGCLFRYTGFKHDVWDEKNSTIYERSHWGGLIRFDRPWR